MSKEAMKLALEAYLCREMPAGTIIGDPKWWAPKIAMVIREALRQALANKALDKMAENARELGLDYEPAQEKDQPVMYTYPSKPEPIPCGKPIGILMKRKGDEHMKLYPLAEQPAQQEPVRLRRGSILRCIETDELCTVWATSTTGRTLVKWSANDFGNYTAEQIGELFWLEPEPDDLELAAEKSDNYAAFHAGYRFAVARGNTGDNT